MQRLPVLITFCVLCTLALATSPVAFSMSKTMLEGSRSIVEADTMFAGVVPGEPLIVQLPKTYQGAPASYELLEGPALSWLVDRSFFWRTLRSERGTLPIYFSRNVQGLPQSTLVLLVELSP